MTGATVGQLLQAAQQRIERLDAEVLTAHTLGQTRAWLFAHADAPVAPADAARLETFITRRAEGEPCALIRGCQDFWTLSLEVTPATLIPRADTELLVELALQIPGAGLRVLDAGTGSGAIAAAIVSERRDWQVFAADLSAPALDVASRNCASHVHLLQCSWLDPIATGSLDVVVSNPPYIEEGDPHLDGLAFEPRSALTAGADGLNAIRALIADARRVLRPGGALILEHGWSQGAAVRQLMSRADYGDVTTHHDLAGHERATMAQWPAR